MVGNSNIHPAVLACTNVGIPPAVYRAFPKKSPERIGTPRAWTPQKFQKKSEKSEKSLKINCFLDFSDFKKKTKTFQGSGVGGSLTPRGRFFWDFSGWLCRWLPILMFLSLWGDNPNLSGIVVSKDLRSQGPRVRLSSRLWLAWKAGQKVDNFLDAQIASDFKSNPPLEIAAISNDCEFGCDFYPLFHRFSRGNSGCDFAGALQFQIARFYCDFQSLRLRFC